MLFITFKVVLLLSSIIVPLGAKKAGSKILKFRVDTDTSHAEYAVNADGMLEKIQRISMSDLNEADQV